MNNLKSETYHSLKTHSPLSNASNVNLRILAVINTIYFQYLFAAHIFVSKSMIIK